MRHRVNNNKSARFRVSPSAVVLPKRVHHGVPLSKRSRGVSIDSSCPFVPPEDWHEPLDGDSDGFRVIQQLPGTDYAHVVTPDDIRRRLSDLPAWMLEPLEVVQLSRMTRKKQTFPCYGMQWGNSLYLYPIEVSLIETFDRPPKPSVYNEARMFGGRWNQVAADHWQLIWTKATIRDFYLNNILIHELGHLLDDRNHSYIDRERYAEWFAIEYGYKPTQPQRLAARAARRTVRRRHHSG